MHGTAGPAAKDKAEWARLAPTGIYDDATHQQDEGNDGDKESGDECGHVEPPGDRRYSCLCYRMEYAGRGVPDNCRKMRVCCWCGELDVRSVFSVDGHFKYGVSTKNALW